MSKSDTKTLHLILLYLRGTNRHDACHRLERVMQIFFDLPYFEGLVLAGAWNEADWYLKGFTKLDDNRRSQKIFFELYKIMFYEALDRSDTAKAVEILRKYLRPFEAVDKEIFTQLCCLLSLDDLREHEELKNMGDMNSMRRETCREITKQIKANPILKDKLEFPKIELSSPRTMIDQNFPSPEPHAPIELHGVGLNAAHSPTEVASIPRTRHSPMQVASIPPTEHSSSLECNLRPTWRTQHSLDFMPRTVIMTLIQGSLVSTMDFNPTHPTVLLVGTNTGEISVWDLSTRERIHHRNFELGNAQEAFQMALASNPTIAANRVRWDSNGTIFGVAFSENIVHLYNYNDHHELTKKSEIEAHVGGVNDIVFSRPHGPLYVITCGDDKTIKVWDAESTSLLQTFEGHSAPVRSVLPQSRRDPHFILSSSMDGGMKAWFYNVSNSVVDCPTAGNSFCNMAYNADETRLFTCGIGEDDVAHLERWNDEKGSIVCSYSGFRNQCNGVPQFDVANSGFLAAGEDNIIKFWATDYSDLLTTTDAEGGLPPLPCIRFNKSGSLLAVSTNDSRFKVLANDDGQQLLNIGIYQLNAVPGPSSGPKSKNGETPISRDAHNSVPEELND